MAHPLRRVLRPVAQSARLLSLHLDIGRFKWANRFSARRVTSAEGPVVSIATYGKRLETAYLTVESIARGSMRPARLLLWLDNPTEFANLPIELKRLEKRGLEVKLSDRNYGPHKKYFPYVMSRRIDNLAGVDGPLVTADDDILYPKDWLRGLAEAHNRAPNLVQCYRARVLQLTDSGLAPYASWELCRSAEPSALTFAIGVSGVIYPSPLLDALHNAGRAFEDLCPRADDLWLHVNALRGGFRVRQISENPIHFPILPGTQADGLQQQNLHNDGNDAQARKTYTDVDIEMLRSAMLRSAAEGAVLQK